jgi:putative restriction endonuclease
VVPDPHRVRVQAIQFVLALREQWVGIPASELRNFTVDGVRVPLSAQQGIFKPALLTEPISIRSSLDSPYNDALDGTRVRYAFAPPSREHDNDDLKRCRDKQLPLIYLVQTKRKPNTEYIVFAPVFVSGWDDGAREFFIDLSEQRDLVTDRPAVNIVRDGAPLEERYVTTLVERRLHQAKFRNQILQAYRERCAVCVLRVRPLLDGAHLVPDRDPRQTIVVSEGMALCALHHRAFDARILRYDASYRIRVELPGGTAAGDGEKAMLLAYDGRTLSLPAKDEHRPIIVT